MSEKTIFNWREFETVECPKCGSGNVAKILYGKPIWSDELEEKLASGEIELGGCFISKEFPVFVCKSCREQWGRLYDENVTREMFDHIDQLRTERSKQKD